MNIETEVRIFLQDFPEMNKLLQKEEFSSEQISSAIKLTVSEYNEMPPKTEFVPEAFPYKYLLLLGIVIYLLRGVGLARSRNRLAHSTGNVSIDDQAMADVYLSSANSLKNEFIGKARDLKLADNVEKGFGNVSSEYSTGRYVRKHRQY